MIHYVRWLYCICSIKNMHFIQFDVITWPCLRGEAFSGTLGGMHHIGIIWTFNHWTWSLDCIAEACHVFITHST